MQRIMVTDYMPLELAFYFTVETFTGPKIARVPLDKSEGPVKDKLSLAMRAASECGPEEV